MINRVLALAMVLSAAAAGPTQAQTSLADIQAAIAGTASELDQVDAMLADTDANRRQAAMTLLMGSGNPAFVKRAKDVGLLSSDPEMQQLAIAAMLDAGGPFRAEFDLKGIDEKTSRIRDWIKTHDGSVDDAGDTGQITFSTMPYNGEQKCWLFAVGQTCALYPTGAVYTLNGWQDGAGAVSLQPDGALVGSFNVLNYRDAVDSVPVRIPLAE